MIIVYQKCDDGQEWLERLSEEGLRRWFEYYHIEPSLDALRDDGVFEVTEEFWEAYERHRAECRTWSRVLSGLFCYTLRDRR